MNSDSRAAWSRCWFAGLAIVVMANGCSTKPQSNYSHVKLIPAFGHITLDSQPLSHAVITFDSPDGSFAFGKTDAEGNYRLQFDSEAHGVLAGPKTVRISTTRKILGLNAEEGAETGDANIEDVDANAAEERVPEKYNAKSELMIEVTPDRTRYDFELAS
ncbi:carboxypeptidase regulatory-like domain-containing protein [bacterium]|nr:carboxypeptidase regulatory-like domain-containing protein [bacterium]